ncbi:MAG TPA: VOC family protein [Methylocella sp.]|nr:VOC family protein [Methylocella sp.]
MAGSDGRFVWYELMTTDIEAAKTFYADVIGWGTRGASMPGFPYSLFTATNVPVTGLMNLPDEARRAGIAPHWMGYVGVDDVDATVARIKQLGGAVRVPPMDVPGISRFSVIADPQMATLALIRGLKPRQGESIEPGTPGRVGWHELFAADWEKVFAFYSELFGWQKTQSHVGAMGTYQQFSAASETIGGMFTKPPALALPFWLYYFNIDNVEAVVRRVEAAGGEILYGPATVPGGAWIVHCMDPQGAIFGLLDRRRRKPLGYYVLRE